MPALSPSEGELERGLTAMRSGKACDPARSGLAHRVNPEVVRKQSRTMTLKPQWSGQPFLLTRPNHSVAPAQAGAR